MLVYNEGFFDTFNIKKSITNRKPISFIYQSNGEKSTHQRMIIFPVCLGKKNTNKGTKTYIRAYLMTGFSHSINGFITGIPSFQNRLSRWRLYDITKIKNLRVLDSKKFDKFKLDSFPEYNPNDSFFSTIILSMKPEPVAKKEPPVEPEEIEKEVPEEPKEKEDIEEESPEETTEEEKEEIKKQNELLIQNEKELIEKLLDNPSVQIEIKRIGQSELFYEYDCVNKKLFVNGVFIEEHIDELDIIKEVLKNVIK